MFKKVYYDIISNDIVEILFNLLEFKGYLVKDINTIQNKSELFNNKDILLILDYEKFCIFNDIYKDININIICLIPNNLKIEKTYDANIKFYELPKQLLNLMSLF